jgi:tetratricopeptide (TPR) repeat protein
MTVAYYNRGVVKMTLGRNEEALLDFDEAIRLDPEYVEAYYNLACLHAKRGDLAMMETNLALAITLNPEYRLSALDDPDFRDVLTTPEFRRAIGKP